jgi:hypothetical protein
LLRRRELTSEDVRRLVFDSIGLIAETQGELDLPICPHLDHTRQVLLNGKFFARPLPRKYVGQYHMAYGAFSPPASITLDSMIPFSDRPLDIPEVPTTLANYTATHEVIHADDHMGGDRMFMATQDHILHEHEDKLMKGMEIIKVSGDRCGIVSYDDLACLWAMQYVDMITHYRAYVVLRHGGFPRLDFVWDHMQNDFFPPKLLTKIEREKDTQYIFEDIIGQMGEYCLIDALLESTSIGDRAVCRYAV